MLSHARVGENIKREIDIISPGRLEVSTKPHRFVDSIVHFGSQYMWLDWGKYMANEMMSSTFGHDSKKSKIGSGGRSKNNSSSSSSWKSTGAGSYIDHTSVFRMIADKYYPNLKKKMRNHGGRRSNRSGSGGNSYRNGGNIKSNRNN